MSNKEKLAEYRLFGVLKQVSLILVFINPFYFLISDIIPTRVEALILLNTNLILICLLFIFIYIRGNIKEELKRRENEQ